MNWYSLDENKLSTELKCDISTGLSDESVKKRRLRHGNNELIDKGGKNPWLILLDQFKAVMVIILIVAAILSAVLGDFKDMFAILLIVILNALLGFSQECKAEKAMQALKKLSVPKIKVKRHGIISEISAVDLVPGDIIYLDAGNMIPADCRILEGYNLRIQEATLTGESEAVEKNSDVIEKESLQIADCTNMAFMGTVISFGRGVAIVTETGMKTELGQIAKMIQSVGDEQTPLQKRLDQLGKNLAGLAFILVGVVFLIGILKGHNLHEMFLTAVSLAVAAVPEGLPAVVTIALALGAQRMLKRKALIRKLPAVETLGSVTVICSDKTGTLTMNQMTVTKLILGQKEIDIDPEDYHGEGLDHDLRQLLVASALCNDAIIQQDEDNPERFSTIGDPTEGALVIAAKQSGYEKHDLDMTFKRISEIPFDSERKKMTTVHSLESENSKFDFFEDLFKNKPDCEAVAITKGAVDQMISCADEIIIDGKIIKFDEQSKKKIEDKNNELAGKGIRVLGVAFKYVDSMKSLGKDLNSLETHQVFIGMIGMIDPARPTAHDSVVTCRHAGIRAIMITGDHPLTARAIACQLEIANEGSRVVTGAELSEMSLDDLEKIVDDVSVYARVSPEHKLNIVQALQNRGNIVSMTGDGVNDAPALKKADIGVAMGITGTDVSKEAADMILQDDNFSTIVKSVKEGRIIFDNIRKFMKYLLSSNVAEIMVMLVAPFLGMPLPLLPIQILWMNLVTDGLPALALGVEKPENDTMDRPPCNPSESILTASMGIYIVGIAGVMTLISLAVGYSYFKSGAAGSKYWQSMLFTTLTFSQIFLALAVRSNKETLIKIGIFSNIPMIVSVIITMVLHGFILYTPILQEFFGTVALAGKDLGICLLLSTIAFWIIEFSKLIKGMLTNNGEGS